MQTLNDTFETPRDRLKQKGQQDGQKDNAHHHELEPRTIYEPSQPNKVKKVSSVQELIT